MALAAKVDESGVVTDVAIVEEFIPSGFVPCNPWVGIGMTLGSPEPLPPSPSREEQEALRKTAYQEEADPIFFMAQRGEATMEEWTAKVAEIKARYPYPEGQ